MNTSPKLRMGGGGRWLPIIALLAILSSFLFGCESGPFNLTVSITPNNGGTVNPSSGVYEGGEITLIATPAKYYQFNGWGGDVSGANSPLTIKMNKNKTVVASFIKIKYDLQLNQNIANAGRLEPKSGSYEAGNQVKLTAIPASGYRFDRWTGSASGTSNPLDVLMDNNKTLSANFIKQYSLKLSSDPIDAGSVTPGSGLYDAGEILTLNAVPNFPYYPKIWVGTDTNTNPATITMNSDKLVTVFFEQEVKKTLEQQKAAGAVSKDALGRWGPVVSIPIQLSQFDWIEGEIIWQTPNTPNTPIGTYVQDPAGNIVKNFGSSKQANFQLMAQNSGRYTIVFQNDSIWYADFHLSYTIWAKQQ